MKLSNEQIEALEGLLREPAWKIVEAIIEEMILESQAERKILNNEFETIMNLAQQQGKGRGLREFVDRARKLSKKTTGTKKS